MVPHRGLKVSEGGTEKALWGVDGVIQCERASGLAITSY